MTWRICEAGIDTTPEFKPGDQPPAGYLARHAWADAQLKGGLRQEECPVCGLWKFPQETCDHVDVAGCIRL